MSRGGKVCFGVCVAALAKGCEDKISNYDFWVVWIIIIHCFFFFANEYVDCVCHDGNCHISTEQIPFLLLEKVCFFWFSRLPYWSLAHTKVIYHTRTHLLSNLMVEFFFFQIGIGQWFCWVVFFCPERSVSKQSCKSVWFYPNTPLLIDLMTAQLMASTWFINADSAVQPSSPMHSVWKLLKMSHLNFCIFTHFCPIKIDLSGNTVWPQASGF